MDIAFLLKSINDNRNLPCIISDDVTYSFDDIEKQYLSSKQLLNDNQIPKNSVLSVLAEFKPLSIAFLLAIIEHDCVVVPISSTIKNVDKYISISETEYFVDLSGDVPIIIRTENNVSHEYLLILKSKKTPGLVLFSSGTTGEPKAALHDLTSLLEKFKKPGKTFRTITFLLFDHIGGFNTLMHSLANGGTIVTIKSRDYDSVCSAIEKYKVELLPTSPTFLNIIILNRAYKKYDMTSLKMISYGTEPMPKSTLDTLHKTFPSIRLKQTYGLSEIGIMSTQSEQDDSLWVKLGGEGYETKIVEDILYIKAQSAMIGYLNAPSPFDGDGWFNTNDKVEINGDYVKILGRTTEIINVGGEKVYPIEVESALLELDGIKDVRVYGEPNPIMGNTVVAEIHVDSENNNKEFIKKIRTYAIQKLERFKIPTKYVFTNQSMFGDRFKKKR